MEVKQAPFAHAIAPFAFVLFAWPFFSEHKLDGLEAVAIIVSSKLMGFVKSNMQTDSSKLHNMHA